MKKQGMIGVALLGSVALTTALALVRPQVLLAQGNTPQPVELLVLATGSQEIPSVDTLAVAFGRLTLSADRKTLSYDILISGLKGKFTGMHLHRGRFGQDGPIVYPLAEPVNGQSKGRVDFNAERDEADLLSQGFYLNIHTDLFPAGEIRGQVVVAPQPPVATATVSFARDIQPIFVTSCSCHTGRFPSEGLNLEPANAFANIVRVKSRQSPLNRVEPGKPAESYLLHKLNGTQRSVGGSGSRMPLVGGPLAPARIQLITTWIQEGALNN